ncbi:hypothetical protein D3C83_185810 [compost metagenome]
MAARGAFDAAQRLRAMEFHAGRALHQGFDDDRRDLFRVAVEDAVQRFGLQVI